MSWGLTRITLQLCALAVALVIGTVVMDRGLERWRIDLTDQGLYTLSEGTRVLLAELEQPVELTLYFSDQESGELPLLRHFAQRLERLLREMERRSDGRLSVQVIDPRPFSDEEDAALLAGLDAVPTGRGDQRVFLGLLGRGVAGFEEALPFIPPGREPFLEYELARMIHVLGRERAPRIGVLTTLPMAGRSVGMAEFDQPPWVIYEQLQDLFDVVTIAVTDRQVPEELDALVVVHPHGLNEALLQAIDGYVTDGGALLLMLDPWSELAEVRASSLGPLLAHWGLIWQSEAFVADPELGLQIALGPEQLAIRHPGVLGLSGSALSSQDVITAELEAVNVATSGVLRLDADSLLTLEPLMQASGRATTLPVERLADQADLVEPLRAMMVELMQASSSAEPLVLAGRLSGAVQSYYQADSEVIGQLNALVFADTDLLADRYWVNRRSLLGTTLTEPFADNGALIVNAIDQLLGGSALMSVRSRGDSLRPFTLVESLRREAEQRWVGAEQRLVSDLNAVDQRLQALREAGTLDEQTTSEELARFVQRRNQLRRDLRQVRRELDQDIERLGARVRALNIVVMPVLVIALAAAMAWRRQRQLKRMLQAADER